MAQKNINQDPSAATGAQTYMIPFEGAVQAISAHAKPLGVERVGLDQADGRILARSVVAQRTSPPVSLSAMDGYAVRDEDIAQVPVSLKIAGKSFAGAGFHEYMAPGTCVRIFTGAAAPDGCGRIIPQEDVHDDGKVAIFSHQPSKARHLRRPGSDFTKGDIIVPPGTRLAPQHLVGIAAADVAHVDVFHRPRTAILCCGDELVEPGLAGSSADKIPESISYGVTALVHRWGGIVSGRWRLPDDKTRIQETVCAATAAADIIVVIGGASVGERDFSKQAFAPLGLETIFAKVAIKPGKPVWFGRMGGTMVLGLPGNPAAALVTARLLLAPLLTGLAGGNVNDALDWKTMPAASETGSYSDRDQFMRATTAAGCAMPFPDQDSAGQKILASATLLIWHGRGSPSVAANTPVRTLLL